MKRTHAGDRCSALYAELAARPYQPRTIFDVAYSLGRKPGRTFTTDLSHVRHMALDDGNEITNAKYDKEQQAYVFFFLPANQPDRGLSTGPLVVSANHARTRMRNTSRHGEWAARNSEDRVGRIIGGLYSKAFPLVEGIFDAVDEAIKQLGDDDGSAGALARR